MSCPVCYRIEVWLKMSFCSSESSSPPFLYINAPPQNSNSLPSIPQRSQELNRANTLLIPRYAIMLPYVIQCHMIWIIELAYYNKILVITIVLTMNFHLISRSSLQTLLISSHKHLNLSEVIYCQFTLVASHFMCIMWYSRYILLSYFY